MKTLPAPWTDDHTNAARLALFMASELGKKRLNDWALKNRGTALTPEMEALLKDLLDIDSARFMLTEILDTKEPAAADIVQSLFEAKRKTEQAKEYNEALKLVSTNMGIKS